MKLKLVAAALALAAFGTAFAAPKAPKWLVLDRITYRAGVSKLAFEGIDELLLTKLVQAKKYKCLDRDAAETAFREKGIGADVGLRPAGYSMRGEIVQMLATGKSRAIGGTAKAEYVATVSLRVNDLKTQQPYEADTLRVAAYCQTPKDMLVFVVQRIALSILMRDYPMYVMDFDDEDDTMTLSYGADFITVGERFEVRRRTEIVDDDTGETVYREKKVGLCEVTDVGKNTCEARLVDGKAKKKDVLRFYDDPEPFAVPPIAPAVASKPPAVEREIKAKPRPAAKPRIAVAPFISKNTSVNVLGTGTPTRNWMDMVADHVSKHLTQTDSFKVLDRSFGPEIDRELKRITDDPNANPNDVCRLSNKLATDYLVVADITFHDIVQGPVSFATGLPTPPASTLFAEVNFRCVMAPTTQIAWADTLRIDLKQFGTVSAATSSAAADWCAWEIACKIQSRLAPEDYARAEAVRAQQAKEELERQKNAPAVPAPVEQKGINVGF